MDDDQFRQWLSVTLDEYARRFPAESGLLDRVRVPPAAHGELDLRDRSLLPFHVTASAVVVRDGKVVLVKHRLLGKWLQPGGHLRLGEAPWEAARREAEEETGLRGAHPLTGSAEPQLLDIDLHEIPANTSKGEPAHLHLDLRFLLAVPAGTSARAETATGEVSQVRWVRMDVIARGEGDATIPHVDPSVVRALAKAIEVVTRSSRSRPGE